MSDRRGPGGPDRWPRQVLATQGLRRQVVVTILLFCLFTAAALEVSSEGSEGNKTG